MNDLGTLFSLNNWPGHLSYVLLAISYLLTDIFGCDWWPLSGCRSKFSISGSQVVICALGWVGPDLHWHQSLPDISACEGPSVTAPTRA